MKKAVIAFAIVLFSIVPPAFSGDSPTSIKVYDGFDAFSHRINKDSDTLYVINFWATWCAPCVREIPYFEELNKIFSEEKFKLLYVSLDFYSQLDSRVIPFVERTQMKGEVVLLNDPDANSWIPKVDEQWTGAIPATLFYSPLKREFYQKEFDLEQLNSIVSRHLGKP